MFRKSVLFLSLFTASMGAANAADFSSWEGRYVGITLGTVFSDAKADLGDYSADIIALDVSNGLFPQSMSSYHGAITGAVNLGYNTQSGSMVYGAEIDFGLSDFDVTHTQSAIDPNPAFPFTGVTTDVAYQTNIDSYATARVRAGMSVGKNLFFGTAGLAAGYVENRHGVSIPDSVAPFFPYTSPDWSEKGWLLGYAVGGGFERKLGGKMSLKAEALYINLADRTIRGEDGTAFPGSYIDYKFANDMIVARLGLNMAF